MSSTPTPVRLPVSICVVHKGVEAVRQYDDLELFIGRPNPYLLPQIDLSVDIYVSRTHARLWLRDGRMWIEDLNSKHGTFVNEVRLDYRRQLNAGDVIRVGETQITVSLPGGSGKEAADEVSNPPELRVDSALNAEEATAAKLADSKLNTRDRMAVLLDLPILFARQPSLDALLASVLKNSLILLSCAERGAVLLKNPSSGELSVQATVPEDAETIVSKALASRAANEGRALVWRRAIDAMDSRKVHHLEMKAGMYAPMTWDSEVLGVLCVDNASTDGEFVEDDLRLLLAVANYAALAVVNLRQRKQEWPR